MTIRKDVGQEFVFSFEENIKFLNCKKTFFKKHVDLHWKFYNNIRIVPIQLAMAILLKRSKVNLNKIYDNCMDNGDKTHSNIAYLSFI